MITSPHEFQTSYEELQGRIHTLLQDAGTGDYKERVLFRRMGVVMHYLADYFTFPHNVTYGGSLKDHCLYERDMKHALRSYVRTSEAQQIFRLQQMRQGQIRTWRTSCLPILRGCTAIICDIHILRRTTVAGSWSCAPG